MLVTDIEITQYQYSREKARHMANGCLTLKDRIVTLFCVLDLPEDESPRSRAIAFVGEAMRQMGRMPEFRSGERKLELAEGIGGADPLLA